MIKTRSSLLFLLFSFSIAYYSFGQSRTIEGVVFDSKKKEPLAFATIGVKGTVVGIESENDRETNTISPRYIIVGNYSYNAKTGDLIIKDTSPVDNLGSAIDGSYYREGKMKKKYYETIKGTNDDKFNIKCMIESATKYAEFSDDWGDEKEMLEWMGTEAYRRIIAWVN